jgi:hypothetical protein
MTRLISQFEASFGVSEDEEADRLYNTYGWVRACKLVQVFESTSQRVYKAFWFRVGVLLSEKPDCIGPLPKERELSTPEVKGKKTVTVQGIKVTRAEFLRWIASKDSFKARN